MADYPIHRRTFIKGGAATGLAALMSACCETKEKTAARKPNVVLIMADDLGYECLGANGGTSYKTPTLDRMASNGVRFEHCYAQPLCTPSRVKLMTGINNVRNYVEFGVLDKSQTTFGHLFRQEGYATCVVGKWQLESGFDGPGHFGFDEYCLWQLNRRPGRYPNPGLEINGRQVDFGNGEYGPDLVSDYACDFIERNKERSFLLYYPMILTHCPFEPTPDSPDWDPTSKGSPTYKGDPKYFGDMVGYMDKLVGKVRDKLCALGLSENTMVIFVGDNGTDRPVVSRMDGYDVAGAKATTTDAGTRVPLIVEWPGMVSRGIVCSDLVDMSDFLPTICEAVEISLLQGIKIDGRSFMPQLYGQAGNPREWIYCWFSRSGERDRAKVFARNQRYKLYATGEFYDIRADRLESDPLDTEILSLEAREVHVMLQSVIDSYAESRPNQLK
ncbi:sulfatase-like hydrolase/transferase [Gemmatimonadota bacterium]